MGIKKSDFAADPERIVRDGYDCVWVWLSDRKTPTPISSPALQWVDWKMLGHLSRYILGEEYNKAKATTFIPTMRKLPTPYLAVESNAETDWEAFFNNCEGLKLKKVLCFCEDGERYEMLEKEFSKRKVKGFPDVVTLASDLSLKE